LTYGCYRDCDVIVVGCSDGRIPWPLGRRRGSPARGPIVYGGLARALQRESNQAISYWWDVTPGVVSKWRRALGIGHKTAGASRLRREYAKEEWFVVARARGQAKARDPERRRKLSEAFKGRTPLRHVIEAARKARLGVRPSSETRALQRPLRGRLH